MIILDEINNEKLERKFRPKFFKDTIYFINIVNTEDKLGVVTYKFPNTNIWQPFCDYKTTKISYKAKTYGELKQIQPINDIVDVRGKFYNTFDTPVEVNFEPISIIFDLHKEGKNNILERKSYYMITDVQELERTFNSNILPCEIISFDEIANSDKLVDEGLKHIIQTYYKLDT